MTQTGLGTRAPRPVIIDTDPGMGAPGADIDDGLAIALALRSPELNVLGLTVVNGNVGIDLGVSNAVDLLHRLGRTDIPVRRGAERPLRRDMTPLRALFDRVLGGAPSPPAHLNGPTDPLPAAPYLVESAAERPGEITLVAIGPMTNIATACLLDPGFAGNVAEIVMMAGSATTYAQNVTVVGDFNAYVDPEALDVVLRSGARIRMVGLDQTARVRLTRDDVASLRTTGRAVDRWTADCADAWIDFLAAAFPHRPEHRDACFLHDPLVVAAVTDPSICRWDDAHVQVETGSELARGLVVADRGLALAPMPALPNAAVAVDTDVTAFHDHFMQRMTHPQLSR